MSVPTEDDNQDNAIGRFFRRLGFSGERMADGAAASSAAGSEGLRHLSGEALAAAVTDPLMIFDRAGALVHANTAAHAAFNGLRDGMSLPLRFRAPEMQEMFDALLSGAAASATTDYGEKLPVERVFRVTASAVGQGTDLYVLIFKDQSESRRIERMRADFIANASHELRTPLASLKGYVETLQGSAKDDPAARARFLAIMSEQAERMARLVDDLLSLSRVEMREFLAPAGEVELGRVLAEVVQSVEPLAKEAGITLSVSCEPAEIMVRGERDEMVQVFQNLVQNAVKYGRTGGRVDVRMAREAGGDGGPDRVRVAVTDDGPGIAPYHLPRLTERFYRVSAADSRAKGGTGLGLAIVKHILNRHRGELRIESTLGRGSTFTVVLPGLKKSSESNS
jgi:two-component system phosphate regulon sensor histidine kinase PhoR